MLQQAIVPRTEWLRSAHLAQTEFLFSDVDATAWHVFHERYVLCGTHRASADIRYRGKTEQLVDGNVMLAEPGEAHRNLVVPQPQNFRVLFIEPVLFEKMAKENGLRRTPHFRDLVAPHPLLTQAIYQLCDSFEASATALEQQSRLLQCVRLAFAHTEETRPAGKSGYNHDAIQRARAYLHERFNEPVGLDELSAIAGLSPYHLVRSFTRRFGLPPHAYQIHVRIERARVRLAAGAPLAEVASSVGFADQSHFTRHFRRIMNVTPANYAGVPR
jgi:AraC-like DNA-binding protein